MGRYVITSPDGQSPLSTRRLLSFIADQNRKGIYVGYGFGYDVTMILADLTLDELASLLDRDSRIRQKADGTFMVQPFSWYGYDLEYIPGKVFRVRMRGSKGGRTPWVTIHDTIGFFQSSFVNALRTWNIGSEDEWQRMEDEKAHRSEFAALTDETIDYNHRECRALALLMEAFRSAVVETGYSLREWQGAGSLASAMMMHHRVPPAPRLDPPIYDLGRSAYYGGRFEVSRLGWTSDVTEYDIASAYPHAITSLPCYLHGQWVDCADDYHDGCIHVVTWSSVRRWGPFPYRRTDGTICYPANGTGTYHGCEIEAAQMPGNSLTIREGMRWHQECECDHFAFVPTVFRERKRIGKSGKGMVLKLGLNSLYGKQAQSVGRPPWANPVAAGLITATTRARMLKVLRDHDRDVLMIATDGIYLDGTVPWSPRAGMLVPHPGLGDWERTELGPVFILQPGVWWTEQGIKVKTRGVPKAFLDPMRRLMIESTLETHGLDATFDIPQESFIGARLAVLRNGEGRGEWVRTVRRGRASANMSKRNFTSLTESMPWTLGNMSDPSAISEPYDKTFGYGADETLDVRGLWEDGDA